MNFCTNCGAKIESDQRFCVSCGREVGTALAGVGAVNEMQILNNEATSGDLFGKMESNVEVVTEPLNPEIVAAEQERKRQEQEYQEKEFARAYLQKQNSLSNNYVLGFIGALLGGLVGAIPWAIVSSQGWFVAWLGYIIAIAASKGYDLIKVKLSMKKLWCVAIAVIIGVLAGQIMSDMISIAMDDELGEMFSVVFAYYVDNFGEYLSINAGNLVLGFIFAALGGFSVLKDIKKETMIIEELKKRNSEETNI